MTQYEPINITDDFVETNELIQNKVNSYTTKREKLAYLAVVKDFVNTSMKMTRVFMKGMK